MGFRKNFLIYNTEIPPVEREKKSDWIVFRIAAFELAPVAVPFNRSLIDSHY